MVTLTLVEAAKLAGVAKGLLHYHLRVGHVKGRQWNRYWMIEPEAVLQFIQDRAAGKYKPGRKKKAL